MSNDYSYKPVRLSVSFPKLPSTSLWIAHGVHGMDILLNEAQLIILLFNFSLYLSIHFPTIDFALFLIAEELSCLMNAL